MSERAEGFVSCLIPCPDPVVNSRTDLEDQVMRVATATAAAATRFPDMKLVVFPAYSTQGSSTAQRFTDEILCDVPGPETAAYATACRDSGVFGIYSLIERNPAPKQSPFNTALLIDATGEIVLRYRALRPQPSIEPWCPGDNGMPVSDGPAGSKIAISISDEGASPELAREAAYQGANIYVRISGSSQPRARETDEQWVLNNRSNAWHNLMYTMAVSLAGAHTSQITSFDGTVLAQARGAPWEILSAWLSPALADRARREGAQDNNLYNLGHRGFTAVPGGESNAGLQWVEDVTAGRYRPRGNEQR